MVKRWTATLIQACLALTVLAVPFLALIDVECGWETLGFIVALVVLTPLVVACATGSVISFHGSGEPRHGLGLFLGYLFVIIGGGAIHAGLITLLIHWDGNLSLWLALAGFAVLLDVLLFVFGYRLRRVPARSRAQPPSATSNTLPGSGME